MRSNYYRGLSCAKGIVFPFSSFYKFKDYLNMVAYQCPVGEIVSDFSYGL